MSKKITINTDLAGHRAGDTIEVTDGAAEWLTDHGYTSLDGDEDEAKPARKTTGRGAPSKGARGDSPSPDGSTAG